MPFALAQFDITGHALLMNECVYVWLGSASTQATISTLVMSFPSQNTACASVLLGKKASEEDSLAKKLAVRTRLPVLLAIGAGEVDRMEEQPILHSLLIKKVLEIIHQQQIPTIQ